MKKLIIPDIHGRSFWKRIKTLKGDYMFVFLGDYLDSFTISLQKQFSNLREIISFKQANPDRVILLWGNHDIQYLYVENSEYRCSGFSDKYATPFSILLKDNKTLFHHLYWDEEDQILYSHAGLQQSLFNDLYKKYGPFSDMRDFVGFINQYEPKEIFNISKLNGGFDEYAGIHWARPVEMERNGYKVKQVVGHSYHKQITYINEMYAICDIAKIIDRKDLTF